jgi:hypothetical protein
MDILFSFVFNAQQTGWFKISDPAMTVRGVITDKDTEQHFSTDRSRGSYSD